MNQPSELIEAYLAASDGREVVRSWYAKVVPNAALLDAVALMLGHDFLNGCVKFLAANGLLNYLMPLIGFEAAPRTLWAVYIAFENHETSDDPESSARSDVAVLLR